MTITILTTASISVIAVVMLVFIVCLCFKYKKLKVEYERLKDKCDYEKEFEQKYECSHKSNFILALRKWNIEVDLSRNFFEEGIIQEQNIFFAEGLWKVSICHYLPYTIHIDSNGNKMAKLNENAVCKIIKIDDTSIQFKFVGAAYVMKFPEKFFELKDNHQDVLYLSKINSFSHLKEGDMFHYFITKEGTLSIAKI